MPAPLGPGPSARRCHYCGHERVHRWGTFAGRQRYRCVECERTFSTFTGTPLYYLKRIECWPAFTGDMAEVRTIRSTARRLGLDKDTVFRWRHRVLAAIETIPQERFRGVVAVGDAPFRYNQKGRSSSQDPPPEHVWVLIALNGARQFRHAVLGSQRLRPHDVVATLTDHLLPDSVLVGGLGPYSPVSIGARRLGIQYRTPTPGRSELTQAGFIPAYVRRFRLWLVPFHGVATRYLTRYMLWFHALDTGPGLTRWSLLVSLEGADRP